ncbi:hypothetical protein F4819DRAFT_509107 [Hypoxylon fuscum]|nr:hypothetical protein F4819DRAFT_509107 [Hypoxylon fuscum]
MSATSKPQIECDGSQGLPPTYGEAVDNKTTNQSAAVIQFQPAPGPAGNGRLFLNEPGGASITFHFVPEPGMDDQHQPWFGQMDVKCCDVPLLMREGFHWTTANVIREEGFVDRIIPELINLGKPNHTCTITRVWILRDLQQPSRWTARLQVHAPNTEVVSGIRLDNWTIDMIRSVRAYGLSKKSIYEFNVSRTRYHFNSIYDDMPLKGWWPWPKEDSLATKRGMFIADMARFRSASPQDDQHHDLEGGWGTGIGGRGPSGWPGRGGEGATVSPLERLYLEFFLKAIALFSIFFTLSKLVS